MSLNYYSIQNGKDDAIMRYLVPVPCVSMADIYTDSLEEDLSS